MKLEIVVSRLLEIEDGIERGGRLEVSVGTQTFVIEGKVRNEYTRTVECESGKPVSVRGCPNASVNMYDFQSGERVRFTDERWLIKADDHLRPTREAHERYILACRRDDARIIDYACPRCGVRINTPDYGNTDTVATCPHCGMIHYRVVAEGVANGY